MISFKISTATCINDRNIGKPNEDLICIDESNGLFLILDGITRPHEEYNGSGDSYACEIDRILRDNIMPEAPRLAGLELTALEIALREVLVDANAAIMPYRNSKTMAEWRFTPGAVGIAAVLSGDTLCCVWAGDCIGVHFSNGQRRLITRQQTLAVAKSGYSKQRIYDEVCNHLESDMAYGIFNGDPELAELLESSFTEIKAGDTIMLCSDGLAGFLQNEPAERILSMSTDEMLTASAPYDKPYADDKAVIRIDF